LSRLTFAALLVTAFIAGVTPVRAAEQEVLAWSGSLRSLNLFGTEAPADLLPDYRVSSTRLRLGNRWQPARNWHTESAIDYQLLGTDPAGVLPLQGDGVNRRIDLDHSWQHTDSWAGRLQIDRLNLHWSSERIDASVGRQAIGFGRLTLFSPLDIIAPFPPEAIDTEIRPGVDALRLIGNYGMDGQLGAVAVFGDNSRHDSYLLTWVDNYGGIDLLAISGELRSRAMLGFGLAGNIGTLGLKAEIAGYHGTRVDTPGGDRDRHFTIAAIEGWYRFDNGLTLLVEYLHNGPGSTNPAEYPLVAAAAPATEGLSTLLGRHYLLAAPNIELHPLVNFNGLLIWNLGDDSWLLRPSLLVSLADNLSLELFWTINQGTEPQRRPAPAPPDIRSEFGSRGDSGGLFLKIYF